MAVLRRSLRWVDITGRIRGTQLDTSADPASLQGALVGHSNAAISQLWGGALTVVGLPAPVAATYAAVSDSARLLYQTAAGDLVALVLPAPMAAIFKPDGQTVDPSAIVDITTAATSLLVSAAGVAVTAFVAGYRE